jgi:serpin B
MFLLNALVFKGEWSTKFDKKLTKVEDFTKGDGSKVKCDLMYRQGDFAHRKDWESQVYQAVVMPFGDTKECRQIVIAPEPGRAIQDVLAVLTAEKLVELCAFDYESEGELWLPRQKLTYENQLNATLQGLGMVDAFDAGSADLTGLYCAGGGNAYVSKVKHKTVFNLDEEGAEGAAVTSVEIGLECIRSPFEMRVDRDFVEFTVTKEGDIKFANYVTVPKSE